MKNHFSLVNEKQLTNNFVKYKQPSNKQNTNNNKKRLIATVILLLLGIILFVVTLIIGLKSILVILLFLLSLITITVGVTCLFWKKINEYFKSVLFTNQK